MSDKSAPVVIVTHHGAPNPANIVAALKEAAARLAGKEQAASLTAGEDEAA